MARSFTPENPIDQTGGAKMRNGLISHGVPAIPNLDLLFRCNDVGATANRLAARRPSSQAKKKLLCRCAIGSIDTGEMCSRHFEMV